jgi:hypothetical protein
MSNAGTSQIKHEEVSAPVWRKWPYNFGVLARGLLNGVFGFCIGRDFNDLRVAKIARLATSARPIFRSMFSGIVWINFSRPKISAANQPTLLRACWSR